MELQIRLTRIRGNMLPANYQYALSAWIYKVIGRADQDYSAFLHEKGFSFEGKKFKLFTFSQLDVRPYRMLGNQIQLLGNEISLIVRFLVDTSMENFIKGLFMHQHCGLGNEYVQTDFVVTGVESKPKPLFKNTMQFQCLSPIVVSTRRDDGSVAYLNPEEPGYGEIFIRNLLRKQAALAVHNSEPSQIRDNDNFNFQLLNTPRKKGITIKENTEQETKVIAYLFNFGLTVTPELQEIGYYAGFGEKNSMGFGTVIKKD